ncbi:MAG TPA: beta-propeller fold lactonase family protein [Steroidobacteraceae bacterium]|nr:beta-propeller fold lactonase family protein [Steroidobacteraceae bacterium]
MSTGKLVRGLLLQAATTALVAACGGGGYGGDGGNGNGSGNAPPPAPAPAAVIRDAQFTDDTVEGLGFSVANVGEGRTDAAGKFQFAQGRKIDFFVGGATNRITIGSATPDYPASGSVAFSLNDLAEAKAANGDAYLGNLLRLLVLLDANDDTTDGFQIDAAANTAIGAAVTGTRTLDFAASGAAFGGDAAVGAIATALHRTLVSADEAVSRYRLLFRQSRSSTIALTGDDTRAVVANRQKASVTVIRVRNADGSDAAQTLAEIPVGKEPRFVAIAPNDARAYVTSAVDGTMSVIDLTASTPAALGNAIEVGVEPRGVAITPNGRYAFVAGHTTGDVAVVNLTSNTVIGRVATGGNPYAIAISNDGDRSDDDERVYVTQLFGEVIDPARPDGFDDAKEGVVSSFRVGDAVANAAATTVTRLLLKPMASGFTADRRNFCRLTRDALQTAGTVKYFNSNADGLGNGAAALKNETFCPDTTSTDITDTGPIAKVGQKVYPNMLFGALLRGPFLYVPNVGAQPEPPVTFNTNVQALVGVLSATTNAEAPFSVNLNTFVGPEVASAPATPLDKLFLNDIVAIDADKRGRNFLVVSRGGNYVIRASIGTDGKLTTLDADKHARRFQTGNLPTGVVMSRDGKRAYSNNELSTSVTAINLADNTVLARDIDSSAPPAPGTQAHRNLVGKLAFFTALGIPDVIDTNGDGQFDLALRDIDPVANKGKASRGAWSSCASCHDDGHADNVTWIFETGPRQTIPLEGTFARNNLDDQRILNWSAVRGSNTDFNNNARGIQGGTGFATNVNGVDKSALVYNHGPTKGISDSLDAMSEWVATVRAPIMPAIAAGVEAHGRALFVTNCASCHGGAKWTKSRTKGLYQDNPLLAQDPVSAAFFTGVTVNDAGVTVAGPQVVKVTRAGGVTTILDNVGTFNVASPIEIRGAAAVAGQTTQGFAPFGAGGFNSPSLLGVALSGPYFHDGSAHTLEEVATRHNLGATGTIATNLSATDLADLLTFVKSIDDATEKVQ